MGLSHQEFPCSALPQQGKEEERKTTTISCFAPAEDEQSRGILGGNFQTRMHDGNKAPAHKVMGCFYIRWIDSGVDPCAWDAWYRGGHCLGDLNHFPGPIRLRVSIVDLGQPPKGFHPQLHTLSHTQLASISRISRGWTQCCCVTELKVPSSRTSSNFDGTGTELVPFQKWWNLS